MKGNGTEVAEPNKKELGAVEVATEAVAPNEKMELAGAVVTVGVVGGPKGTAVVVGTSNAVGPPKLKDVEAPAVKLKGVVEVLGTAELLVTDASEEYGAEVTGPKDGAGGFESVSEPKLEIGFEFEAAVVVVSAMLNPANELLETVGILKFCGSASIFLIGSMGGRSNALGSSGFGFAAD